MNAEWPKRKPTRLNGFDYSSAGAYFVTICARDRMKILSEIVKFDFTSTDAATDFAVGEGLAPPGYSFDFTSADAATDFAVGEGLAPPEYSVKLKPCGEIAREQLQMIETRFPTVTVEDFVIMPDHIHMVLILHKGEGGASPSPTLNDVICAFKSLTARYCKQRYGIEKIFQRSYAEHIVRDREDYEARRRYILENPMRWYYKNASKEERANSTRNDMHSKS